MAAVTDFWNLNHFIIGSLIRCNKSKCSTDPRSSNILFLITDWRFKNKGRSINNNNNNNTAKETRLCNSKKRNTEEKLFSMPSAGNDDTILEIDFTGHSFGLKIKVGRYLNINIIRLLQKKIDVCSFVDRKQKNYGWQRDPFMFDLFQHEFPYNVRIKFSTKEKILWHVLVSLTLSW